MKKFIKFLIFIIIVGIGFGGYYGYKGYKEHERIEEAKKGWYVEITNDYINVRSKANTNAEELGKVNKGEIYKVNEIDLNNSIYYWYNIELKDGSSGWIASKRNKPFVKDVNNPTDIAVPKIKFYDNIYKVVSIDDINYKHLEVVEDTDKYTISHIIYHEVDIYKNINQYWILYTITDGAGKSSSKMQKVEFEITPDESLVQNFADYDPLSR